MAALGGISADPASHNAIEDRMEAIVMDALGKALGLGEEFLHTSGMGGGIIQNTASDALVAVVAAARTAMHLKVLSDSSKQPGGDQRGCTLQFVAYMSDQTHFCAEKACRVAGVRFRKASARGLNISMSCEGDELGIGHGPRFIASSLDETGNFPVNVARLKEAIAKDREQGLTPILFIANYGATNTCAVDPLDELGLLCREEGIMLHVDAAYGGTALILDSFRGDAAKIRANADSVNVNGSKWLGTGFSSAFLWVKDRRHLTATFGSLGKEPSMTRDAREGLNISR
ncbi:hypothetical protein FOZ62_001970, partial [Perkinsus olseni]